MSISSTTQYAISCDSCCEMQVLNQGDFNLWTLKDALRYCREWGWKIGKKVKCPKCAGKKLQEDGE